MLSKPENANRYFLIKENLSSDCPANNIMDVVNSYEKVKPEILFSNQFTTFEAQYDFEIDLVEYGKQLTNNSCPTT